MKILPIFLLFFLAGCVSIPTSPTPRFYSIQPIDKDEAGEKLTLAAGVIIGFGPVKIPEYQNRPQIVTKNKDKTFKFAQFDRWVESLDHSLTYVMSENLARMLPEAVVKKYPWSSTMPVRYQIMMDVLQMESELDGDLFFVVQWAIYDAKNEKVLSIKRSEFRQPIVPHNYSGLVEILNNICVSLSREIAEAVVSAEGGYKK